MSATRSALLAAVAALLTSDGIGNILAAQSPPQFDASLKLATMAAVQRALGNMNGFTNLAVSTVLTAANIGEYIVVGSVSGLTHTLPAASLCPGGKIAVYNYASYATTFAAPAGTKINVGTAVGTLSSAIVSPGENAIFYSDGTNWSMFGSMQMTQSQLFALVKSNSGYQKLPSGLLIQWGFRATAVSAPPGSSANNWTFPIAFPNACLAAFATAGNDVGTACSVEGLSASQASGFILNIGSSTATLYTNWLSFGF